MRFVLPAPAKLNLTLRVTGRRPDGYHDLVSAFARISSGETLLVGFLPPLHGADEVCLSGMEVRIEGENVVARALRLARDAGFAVPPLRVEVVKALCPGSGLGAGSGNAATLLGWLAEGWKARDREEGWLDVARRTGSDVPFLFSGLRAALAAGTGDRLAPLDLPCMRGWAVVPEWSVGTENAYSGLDAFYGGRYPLSDAAARAELARICGALERGERAGLLPNDFAPPLIDRFPAYGQLFDEFERAGCAAWGITGSGGAAFGLATGEATVPVWPDWTRQVLPVTI